MSSSAGLAAGSIPVVVGPTAAGKSGVGMWLAGRGEPVAIISADSRQVYRGFDVGTAKPTRDELLRVPHEGIDVADPGQRYSAYAWADMADAAIDRAIEAGRRPLIVGGTGLYIRTLFEPGFVEPELDQPRRAALQAILGAIPTEELRRWVAELDPERVHLGRTQLLRSVEIALLTGQRLSDLHRTQARTPRWRPRYLVVDPGQALAHRIASRAEAMLAGAWQDEVRRLMEWVPPDAPAWKSSGYGAVRDLVAGATALAQATERVVIETRQYAKRQRTWFRHQLPPDVVTRVDPTQAGWEDIVTAWWEGDDSERAA